MSIYNVNGYPSTTKIIKDNTNIKEADDRTINSGPIILAACATDRGTEELHMYNSEDEFLMEHGPINFNKYGQEQEQVRLNLAAKGRVLFKRLVSNDATLANIVIIAKVVKAEDKSMKIEYSIKSCSGAKNVSEIEEALTTIVTNTEDDENTKSFPIIALSEIGRGDSIKRIKIKPDYIGSETLDYMQYLLTIEYDYKTTLIRFSLNPDKIVNRVNVGIRNKVNNLDIIKCCNTDKYIKDFISFIQTNLSDDEDIQTYDLINCKDKDGETLDNISISDESISLNSKFGIKLSGGSAGKFDGNVNLHEVDEYTTLLESFYKGVLTNKVYDTDRYKLSLIFGGNFPESVNKAIIDLVEWRKDCVFIADFGTNIDTLEEIEGVIKTLNVDSPYIHNYPISYDILEPTSYTQAKVTACYDLSYELVNHLRKSPHIPFAGISNGAILSSAIKGTINFEPIKTKLVDQKSKMKKLRANYAKFDDDIKKYVIETVWTSKKALSQLTFCNNLFELQDIMRDTDVIKKRRYNLANPHELEQYEKDINDEVISKHLSRVKNLEFAYKSNTDLENQKVYYGVFSIIPFNFYQEEYFEYIISND